MGTTEDVATNEIHAVIAEMSEAYVSRDLDAFVDFFTDDIVAMPSGMAPIVGIEDWKALLTRFFGGSDISNLVTKSEDITVVGDWAIEWHNEASTSTRKDTGESNRNYNKGMWIFRKIQGRWKIARYIWNANPELEPNT